MGRPLRLSEFGESQVSFPMIPPQVNGATYPDLNEMLERTMFPMIPPQVNGATGDNRLRSVQGLEFPMIPPQVNGATWTEFRVSDWSDWIEFPMIPPQVNGATDCMDMSKTMASSSQ